MKCYAIAEVSITDPHWVPDYLANVNGILEKFGGRYLARTGDYEIVEGASDRHQTSIILEFPSKEAAYSFYGSDEYEPYKAARLAGSESRFYFVAGEDAAAR